MIDGDRGRDGQGSAPAIAPDGPQPRGSDGGPMGGTNVLKAAGAAAHWSAAAPEGGDQKGDNRMGAAAAGAIAAADQTGAIGAIAAAQPDRGPPETDQHQ
ncbi:MAG: hypothetical protein Fur0042_28370 [Cyanophyceae cyanobacterium]